MLIGTAQIELFIPGSHSLKEKRFILKSIKARIQNQFNVSIAEVDFHDKWQRSCLGVACISNERKHAEKIIDNILRFIERDNRLEIIDQAVEIL